MLFTNFAITLNIYTLYMYVFTYVCTYVSGHTSMNNNASRCKNWLKINRRQDSFTNKLIYGVNTKVKKIYIYSLCVAKDIFKKWKQLK